MELTESKGLIEDVFFSFLHRCVGEVGVIKLKASGFKRPSGQRCTLHQTHQRFKAAVWVVL